MPTVAKKPAIRKAYLEEVTGYTWDNVPWKVVYELCCSSVYWVCFFFNFKPTPQQAELLDMVDKGCLRMACKSGQGPGKTTCSTLISFYWTLRSFNTRTLLTAPSMKLCRDVFLAEARKRMMFAHPYLRRFIEVTKSKVLFGGPKFPNWMIIPVTAGATDAIGMQGQHDDNMNIIVEEASGVSRANFEALEGTASNTESEFTPDAKPCAMLVIGNPNDVGTSFHDCFTTERGDGFEKGWACLTFNAEKSPIVNKSNIERIARKYGRDSDVYRVRVLGEFPKMDPRGIIALEDLEACTLLLKDHMRLRDGGRKQFGIDIARQGGDETVVVIREGGAVIEWKRWVRQPDFEPADAIRWCFRRQMELGWSDDETVYIFDAGGMGQGVIHLFRDANKEYFPFHTQGRARNKREYANKLTEAFFHLASRVRARAAHIPNDGLMISQLANRHYTIQKTDTSIKAESKEDYMKRTEKTSPDRADAIIMAFYNGLGTPGQVARKEQKTLTLGIEKMVDFG